MNDSTMDNKKRDIAILRDLAKRLLEVFNKDVQNKRRRDWRTHNSLHEGPPLIWVRDFAWDEIFDPRQLKCEDNFYRSYEKHFHEILYRDSLEDDMVIEPWITLPASYAFPSEELCRPASGNQWNIPSPSAPIAHATRLNYRWGPEIKTRKCDTEDGAWMFVPPLEKEEDLEKLVMPHHVIDETETFRTYDKLKSAIGDIIDINIDRGPAYIMWTGDISSDIAFLRGLEQIMWDMIDRPSWVHKLAGFLSEAVLNVHHEAEKAGDWHLANHQNQSMPYSEELDDPKANGPAVKKNKLWGYMAAQEFTTVSPEMFDEFILTYQLPILREFGLVSYGCCEDLTKKIPFLRKIPNLRRIAIAPWANVRECAEQIGDQFVISWRPNPTEMVCTGFDENRIKKILEQNITIFKANNCIFDITIKDVPTVQKNPQTVVDWIKTARKIIEHFY